AQKGKGVRRTRAAVSQPYVRYSGTLRPGPVTLADSQTGDLRSSRLLRPGFQQFLRCFRHLVRGQAVVLIQMLRHVGRLAELTFDAEGLDAVRNAGLRERV